MLEAPITLEKLQNATAQDLFDYAVIRMAEQGGPSVSESGCAYRGGDGHRCGVGHLLPDQVYQPEMEGLSLVGLMNPEDPAFLERMDDNPGLAAFREAIGQHRDLLDKVQTLHDVLHLDSDGDYGDWAENVVWRAGNLAEKFGLSMDNIKARLTPRS